MTDATVTISLEIENTYDDGESVMTYVTDKVIPAPPVGVDSDGLHDWALDQIYPFTGTGREEGDSFYDVTVTACSDPALVGENFEFGY